MEKGPPVVHREAMAAAEQRPAWCTTVAGRAMAAAELGQQQQPTATADTCCRPSRPIHGHGSKPHGQHGLSKPCSAAADHSVGGKCAAAATGVQLRPVGRFHGPAPAERQCPASQPLAAGHQGVSRQGKLLRRARTKGQGSSGGKGFQHIGIIAIE